MNRQKYICAHNCYIIDELKEIFLNLISEIFRVRFLKELMIKNIICLLLAAYSFKNANENRHTS